MVAFANPVQGYIHPVGWKPPAGSLDMYVIRDCADHAATGQGCALDINNGRCDGKVLASGPGVVKYREDLQGIVRILHPDGSRSDYAHMKPILVVVGQAVTLGQQIGEIGDAHDPSIPNFSGCHLHYAVHLSWNGPEVDPWPYMNQSGGDMLKGTNPKRIVNRQTSVLANGTRFRPSPSTAEPELTQYPAGAAFYPDWLVEGGAVSGSIGWFAGWGDTPTGKQFGYLHGSTLAALTPIESGYTDKDINDAKKVGATVVSAAASAAASKF